MCLSIPAAVNGSTVVTLDMTRGLFDWGKAMQKTKHDLQAKSRCLMPCIKVKQDMLNSYKC